MTIHPKFTPELLLSAPRRSAGIPNASGSLIAFTESTYSFESHSTAKELRVLDVETGKSVFITNAFQGVPQWLGDQDKLIWLKGAENGNTSFVTGDAYGKSRPYTAGTVPGPVSDLKLTKIASDKFGIVVSGKSNQDGSLHNPTEAKKPLSSGKLYTSLFVRHWDKYIQPQKNALWYGTLQLQPSIHGRSTDYYCLSELKNLFRLLDLKNVESPIPPFGGTDHFDICPRGIVFITKDPALNPALHTKCVLYYCALPSWTEAVPLELKTVKINELNGALASPVLSSVDNMLALLAMREDGYESDKNRLIIIPNLFDGGYEPVEVFATKDGIGAWRLSPGSLTWAPDDSSLFIQAEDVGQGSLFQLPITPAVGSSSVADLVKLAHRGSITSVVPVGNNLYLTSSNLVEPSYYTILELSPYRVLSEHYASSSSIGLSHRQIDEIWWRGAHDHPVHAWVVKPSHFNPNEKYPLCYLVHGGPQGAWNNQWSTRWNPAIFAEQGYVVIAPNPTGSTGYGQPFTDAIQNSWGGRPYEDLVRGFEYIERNLEYVDTTRAVALGASYGGYMMNWMQGHELGRKFKALVTHDGIFSTRFALATEELYFPIHDLGGVYWNVPQNWDRWDPSRFLDKWSTPQLIIHSALDYRLSIAEGLAAFNALQMRGVESAFLTFPDENHWVLKPENSLVWHRTVLNWVNKFVGLEPVWVDEEGGDEVRN
ncbi:hypothetical protein AJ80_07965 [Polytolypa hystricis UAMH7299]|uniref:Dipeptidyl-peptidase V n=1 Tax=Polytolypa hystricis (strain UAMH7299) TaxID=1447883 RepID=A0A2B7XFP5_POLH7|nr:hypothetical protein AJ80_07965 [Polytolypa hystricis UAMH7299]